MNTSSATSDRFYLTTPIYYVNARPHLGHAYSTIVCDAIARRKRALGIETWFLTGTDEHGQKIERSAELAGRTPEEFAGAISAEFRGLWDQLELSYDDYIRTTSPRHSLAIAVANSIGVRPASAAERSIFCPCSSVPVKNQVSMPSARLRRAMASHTMVE